MLIMARIEIPAKEKCFFYVCMSIHTLFMSLITKKLPNKKIIYASISKNILFFFKSDSRKHNIRSVLTTDIKILSKKSLLKVSQTRETQCAIVNKKSAKKC